MTEHQRAVRAIEHELEQIATQLKADGLELTERLSRLRSTRWKIVRDAVGAGGGIVLAGPTTGVSLLVTFWTMTSLLIDNLDAWRERDAVRDLQARMALLLRRQAELTEQLEALARKRND